MTTKKKSEGDAGNYGTYEHEEYGQRIAGSPADAVQFEFDGWKKVADATAPDAPVSE